MCFIASSTSSGFIVFLPACRASIAALSPTLNASSVSTSESAFEALELILFAPDLFMSLSTGATGITVGCFIGVIFYFLGCDVI